MSYPQSDDPGLRIAIMAGGLSRRMGRDKAALPVAGVPMLDRVVRASLATGLPVMVVGRRGVAGIDDAACIEDEAPGSGPLGAIATALRAAGGPVLALACDMPLLSSGAIGWLAAMAPRIGSADGVVTMNAGRPEPLFSIYAPSALGAIDRLMEREELAVRSLLSGGDFLRADLPGHLRGAIRNINTPGDLLDIQ